MTTKTTIVAALGLLTAALPGVAAGRFVRLSP